MSHGPISAAVLAGGESRRFGSDKALAIVPGGSERIIERTIRVLRQVADDVTIIAPADRAYGEIGVPVVSERPSGEGPLGGLIAALTIATHPRCFVVSCDLPFIDARVLRWMASRRKTGEAVVPVIGHDRRPQPLHAIYGRPCLATLTRLFDEGERRLLSVLGALEIDIVAEIDLRAVDPELTSFVNVNSMDDLLAAERLAAGPTKTTR